MSSRLRQAYVAASSAPSKRLTTRARHSEATAACSTESYMQVRTLLVAQRAPGGTTVVEGHSRNLRNLCNLRIFNPLYCLRNDSLFALSGTGSDEQELGKRSVGEQLIPTELPALRLREITDCRLNESIVFPG
jgi:hypothetical protein